MCHALPLGAVRESERALLSAGATRGRRRVRQTSLPGWPGEHFLAPGSKCVFSAISGARTAPQASGSRRVLIDGGRRKTRPRAGPRAAGAGGPWPGRVWSVRAQLPIARIDYGALRGSASRAGD
jgi:hypothetical protein